VEANEKRQRLRGTEDSLQLQEKGKIFSGMREGARRDLTVREIGMPGSEVKLRTVWRATEGGRTKGEFMG